MENGGNPNPNHHNDYGETRSTTSQKSTRSASRSSVLERARAYSRKMENGEDPPPGGLTAATTPTSTSTARSPSSGRSGGHDRGNRPATRERAMASVRAEPLVLSSPPQPLQSQPLQSQLQSQSHRSPKQQPQPQQRSSTTPRSKSSPSRQPPPQATDPQQTNNTTNNNNNNNGDAVVTPELLVDALSGHEDGLLAIAERLMEHYDSGYDVMGEAIIDAFADVQKLFQHVVEAAHMEGAAFESSRREAEMMELRKQAANAMANGDTDANLMELAAGGVVTSSPSSPHNPANGSTPAHAHPNRHDEFIDQDVKDVLNEAIRNGAPLRDADNYAECYQLYETACHSASSLLPVDSDHRGRLQLSIARAESMSADRACAILRYAMDDVLRSGLRATQFQPPPIDVSQRGDCVLDKPKDHPSLLSSGGAGGMGAGGVGGSGIHHQAGVIQSSEEALASLVEEMKEVLNAPIYENTPLQSIAERFWNALGEAQRSNSKTNERLEQNLGKLKGEFLLARAEWEEKLNGAQETSEAYKRKYLKLKETQRGEHYMDQARHANLAQMAANGGNGSNGPGTASDTSNEHDRASGTGSGLGNFADSFRDISLDSIKTNRTVKSTAGSVASLGSGLAQQAKSIASTFSCGGTPAKPSDKDKRKASTTHNTTTTTTNPQNQYEDPETLPYRRSRSENVPRSSSSQKLPSNPPLPHNSQSYDLTHQPPHGRSRSSSRSKKQQQQQQQDPTSTTSRRSTKSSSFTRLEQEV